MIVNTIIIKHGDSTVNFDTIVFYCNFRIVNEKIFLIIIIYYYQRENLFHLT